MGRPSFAGPRPVAYSALNGKGWREPARLYPNAKVDFEPILTNAAFCVNVCSQEAGQKRDKIKVDFAKGLWRKNFQRFQMYADQC